MTADVSDTAASVLSNTPSAGIGSTTNMPMPLPNDFCLLPVSVDELSGIIVVDDKFSGENDNAKKRFILARVVMVRPESYKLNWFAQRPGNITQFLKTDVFFDLMTSMQVVPSVIPALTSSQDLRDVYCFKNEHEMQESISSVAVSNEFAFVPTEYDLEDVRDLFEELAKVEKKRKLDSTNSARKKASHAVSKADNQSDTSSGSEEVVIKKAKIEINDIDGSSSIANVPKSMLAKAKDQFLSQTEVEPESPMNVHENDNNSDGDSDDGQDDIKEKKLERSPSICLRDADRVVAISESEADIETNPPPVSIKRLSSDLEDLSVAFVFTHWTQSQPKIGDDYQVDAQQLQNELDALATADRAARVAEIRQKVESTQRIYSPKLSEYYTVLNYGKPQAQIDQERREMPLDWTPAEKAAFESALYLHSTRFNLIAKAVAKASKGNKKKTTNQCVQYFFDIFSVSRAFNIWNKHELNRQERAERARREEERQRAKDLKRDRKKRLLAAGIDPKLHNYHGEAVIKSDKIVNALLKVRKAVVVANGGENITDFPVPSAQEFEVADKLEQLNNMNMSVLENMDHITRALETNLNQRKEDKTEKQLRNINEILGIQQQMQQQMDWGINMNLGMNNLNMQQRPGLGIGLMAFNDAANQMNNYPSANEEAAAALQNMQAAYLNQLLQQNQAQSAALQNEFSGGNGRMNLQNQRTSNSAQSAPTLPSNTESSRPGSQAQPLSPTEALQSLAGLSNAISTNRNISGFQLGSASKETKPNLNFNVPSLHNIQLENLQNLQQRPGKSGSRSGSPIQNINNIPGNAAFKPVEMESTDAQMQLLQILQAKQMEHVHTNNFMHLQQVGQLPENFTFPDYMNLVNQQEHWRQNLRQLQLLQQLEATQAQMESPSDNNNLLIPPAKPNLNSSPPKIPPANNVNNNNVGNQSQTSASHSQPQTTANKRKAAGSPKLPTAVGPRTVLPSPALKNKPAAPVPQTAAVQALHDLKMLQQKAQQLQTAGPQEVTIASSARVNNALNTNTTNQSGPMAGNKKNQSSAPAKIKMEQQNQKESAKPLPNNNWLANNSIADNINAVANFPRSLPDMPSLNGPASGSNHWDALSQQLEQSFQFEKMKLQLTYQQEAFILQMRQMHEIQLATFHSQEKESLLKKQEQEQKNLVQTHRDRQQVLENEYHQNLMILANGKRTMEQEEIDKRRIDEMQQLQMQPQQMNQLSHLQQVAQNLNSQPPRRQIDAPMSVPPPPPPGLVNHVQNQKQMNVQNRSSPSQNPNQNVNPKQQRPGSRTKHATPLNANSPQQNIAPNQPIASPSSLPNLNQTHVQHVPLPGQQQRQFDPSSQVPQPPMNPSVNPAGQSNLTMLEQLQHVLLLQQMQQQQQQSQMRQPQFPQQPQLQSNPQVTQQQQQLWQQLQAQAHQDQFNGLQQQALLQQQQQRQQQDWTQMQHNELLAALMAQSQGQNLNFGQPPQQMQQVAMNVNSRQPQSQQQAPQQQNANAHYLLQMHAQEQVNALNQLQMLLAQQQGQGPPSAGNNQQQHNQPNTRPRNNNNKN